MYYELTKQEIKAFIKRYFNPYDEYTEKITSISRIDYKGVKEYLINNEYMLRIYKKNNVKF